jgi:hypothetical protein
MTEKKFGVKEYFEVMIGPIGVAVFVGLLMLGRDCDRAENPAAYCLNFAQETCNGRDDDCDGEVDEVPITWYKDFDFDGYGESAVSKTGGDCTRNQKGFTYAGLPYWSPVPGDCNGSDPQVYPGAPEVVGDQIDNNCDGVAP